MNVPDARNTLTSVLTTCPPAHVPFARRPRGPPGGRRTRAAPSGSAEARRSCGRGGGGRAPLARDRGKPLEVVARRRRARRPPERVPAPGVVARGYPTNERDDDIDD